MVTNPFLHPLRLRLSGLLLTVTAAATVLVCGCAKEPETKGAPPQLRRLTEEQYRKSISDIFGADIQVPGRFEPDIRKSGLRTVGASVATVTSAGFEQYDLSARSIATQVVDEKHRGKLIPCTPKDASAADDACAEQAITKFGRLLYRRSLTNEQRKGAVAVAHQGAQSLGDFYSGLKLVLGGFLASPHFLFIGDVTEPNPDKPGEQRLDGYSKASRLSFFLWDAPPDEALLKAAEDGKLHTQKGVQEQVNRMVSSPRFEDGVRAFFSDMLGLEAMADLAKDSVVYPAFSTTVSADAREQTLRTITHLVLEKNGDYRDLFTTRETFMTQSLARVYHMPAAGTEWNAAEFAPEDDRAGLTGQISFLALHSHPGRSSSTLRGKAVREILLCQKVPDPPPNVDFSVVQDPNNSKYKTARERLSAHATDEACANCHKIIDPIGLAMEHFDGTGQFRKTENKAPIDASGVIDGIKFGSAVELGQALHDHPSTPKCLTDRLYAYTVGRPIAPQEKPWMDYLYGRFAKERYSVSNLFRDIADSEAFYKVSVPAESAAKVAVNDRSAAAL